jgi:predicted nucleotide-binding protein/Zn-dependent protease with chaperone function
MAQAAAVTALSQAGAHQADVQNTVLPALSSKQALDVKALRDEYEHVYSLILWMANGFVFLLFAVLAVYSPAAAFAILFYCGLLALVAWISWKLAYAFVYGHGIEVGPNQFPLIYAVVKNAAELLEVPVPTVIILQGHGMFELFVAKRFTRRGLIMITSNMLDEFCQRPTSREFMMFVGRQLGHIKAGHFRGWFFRDVIGLIVAYPFNRAWWRRCHLTADKIGMLVAGDLQAAEQALCLITVGARSAPGINIEEVCEQRTKLFESFWSWIQLTFSAYPYMVDRIARLRRFASQIGANPLPNVGAVPIQHTSLRPIPVLVIHGHDRLALLELKDYLRERFPQIVPRVMASETFGSLSMPEKFERVANDVNGAIAIVTPDDIGNAVKDMELQLPGQAQLRPRQNVIMEIGWAWGRLGRGRCLLLVRGAMEMPSDIAGVDAYPFHQTPAECGDAMRDFVATLEREMRLAA